MSETNGPYPANSKEKRQFVIYSKGDIHAYVDTHQPDHDIKSAQ
ncbi:hypothetical protein [Photobacterium sp. 1_MG-2023]|nr:hypothetical protein [Photobacterium sp. 1_MG-2023]MDO6706060.1 hypothetical protein [Photobacterium sp. 1_MG-2023]